MNENENKYLDYAGLAALINEIKSRFPSSSNLKTVDGTSIIGSGDIDTKQFKVLDFGSNNRINIWDLDPGDYIIPDQNSTKYIICRYDSTATSSGYSFKVNRGGLLYVRAQSTTSRLGMALTVGIHPNSQYGMNDASLTYFEADTSDHTDLYRVGVSQILTRAEAQTITGVKTFNALPETSYNPTTANQLVRKGYIDTILNDIYTKSQTYSKAEVESYVATALSTALADYYTKSQTYNKQEIDAKIDQVTFNAITYNSSTETLVITTSIAGGNGEEY